MRNKREMGNMRLRRTLSKEERRNGKRAKNEVKEEGTMCRARA